MPERDIIHFLRARQSPPRDINVDFEDLVDTKKSLTFDRQDFEQIGSIPDVTGLIDLAKEKQGFKIETNEVVCPLIVVRESNAFSYEMTELTVTFGTSKHRPKLMAKDSIKRRVLAKMQGVSEYDICKDACKGLLVGLKGIECLVLLPLQDTELRQQDIEQGKERHSETGLLPNESKAIERCCQILIGLGDHINTFDDTSIHAFQTPIVSGNQQKITQSQVYVPKLLWKGLFKNHPKMMEDKLVNRVFVRVLTRKRSEGSGDGEVEGSTDGTGDGAGGSQSGKSPSYRHEALKRRSTAGKYPKMDAIGLLTSEDVQTGLLTALGKKKIHTDPFVYRFLEMFVTEFREVVDEHDYVAEMGEFLSSTEPVPELIEYTNGLGENPDFKKFIESLSEAAMHI